MKKLLPLAALLPAIANATFYDVFIDFGGKVQDKVQNIAHMLDTVGVDSLYKQDYVVHLTLYLTDYNNDKLPQIKAVVDKLAAQTKPFKVKFNGIHATGGNWLMLDAEKSTTLQALADEATNALLPLRDTNAPIPNWAKNLPAKVKSFQQYGSPNVFQNFDPHITLTTPANKIALSQFFRAYPFAPFSGTVKGIGITAPNALGQAKTVIYYKALK